MTNNWKKARKIVFAVLPYVLLCVSCDYSTEGMDSRPNTIDAQKAQSIDGAVDPLERIGKLYQERGFDVPCVKGAFVEKSFNPLGKQVASEEVFSAVYTPQNCSEDDGDVYSRLVGGTGHERRVTSIIEYRTRERTFAYTVSFHIKGTNAVTELTYLDTDKNNTLDTVFQSSSLPKPVLPIWLKTSQKQ